MADEFDNPVDEPGGWVIPHQHGIPDVPGLQAALDDMNARAAMLQAVAATLGARLAVVEAKVAQKPEPIPDPSLPPPDPTSTVTNLADFKAALLDGEKHITIAFRAEGIDAPILIPRIAERTIVGAPGAFLGSDGSDFHILKVGQGRGGKLTLRGDLTIDGGWRIRPGECPGDQAAQLWAPGMDELRLEGITTQNSRRTGFYAVGCKRLTLQKVRGHTMPRDFIWCNDSEFVLIEDCDVQHCGDDGIGCHMTEGKTMRREVVIRRNRLRDCLGIKVLGGSDGDGFVLIEDNEVIACGFYGVRLGKDYTTGEGDIDQRNITVRRNKVIDLQSISRCHPGQVYGAGLTMDALGRRCENVVFEGNTVTWPNPRGRLRDAYPWASAGFYSKTGFVVDGTMTPATTQRRVVCANPGDVAFR
jgi:hypothetical protein